jgi:hypothetical protein
MDLSALSTEELMRMRGAGAAPAVDLSSVPTEELMKMRGAAEPPRSAPDEFARQVGLTARAGVKGLVSIPAMLGDALGMRSNASVDRLLDTLGLPAPGNATERVAGDVAGAMAGQGGMIKLGDLLARSAGPVMTRIGNAFRSDPGTQVAAAGAGSGASGTVREAGGGPVEQFAAGMGAGSLIPIASMLRPRSAVPTRTQDLLDTAAEHDVPLSYSDVTGKAKRLDTSLEYMPFVGTAKYREEGAKKATAAAERVVGEAKGELDSTGFRGMAQLQAAAKAGDKSAQRVVDQVANAGDDWQKIMQASGNLKLWRSREAAAELYTKVEKLSGGKSVPLTKTQLALDDAIVAETSSKLPDETLLKTLEKLRANIIASPTDFSAARGLRSDLGKIIANKYTGENALVGAKGAEKLSGIQAALEGDMEQFAVGQGGALEKAWRRADSFYKNAVVPYKDRALAKALTSDTPDEIYSQFIRVGRSGSGEDRAAKFYDALEPKGKAAVRYGMLANATDDAAIPGKDAISPARFSQSLERIQSASGVFFKGEDKEALDGFVNLMRHAERFGQYTENPPTGQRVIPFVSLLGALWNPKVAAAIGVGSWLSKEVLTRPALRDLLIQASHAKPGSIELQKLGEQLARQAPQAAATTSRPTSSQPEEP